MIFYFIKNYIEQNNSNTEKYSAKNSFSPNLDWCQFSHTWGDIPMPRQIEDSLSAQSKK